MADYPMTKKGYDNLRSKLHFLKTEAIPKAEQKLGAAREHGDLSENTEFMAAREEIWQLERQIGELSHQLANSEIVDSSRVDQTSVSFGATVKIYSFALKEEETWTIVGHGEADVDNFRISILSPLASGLIGAKKDDIVEIQLPAGKRKFKILSFTYDDL